MKQLLLLAAVFALLSASARAVEIPALSSITFSNPNVVGGSASIATVRLDRPAASGGFVVRLYSSNSVIASVPSQITIAPGAISKSFVIATTPVNANPNVVPPGFAVTITASHPLRGFPTGGFPSSDIGGTSRSASLRVLPPALTSISSWNPTGGSRGAVFTVRLNGAAASEGVTIHLASSHPSIVEVPASVTIPAGERDVQFAVSPELVASKTSIIITAQRSVFNTASCTLILHRSTLRFTILAAITRETANYYGGFNAARQRILTQIDTVNARFNRNAPFIANFAFVVDSVYQFDGNAVNEVKRSHPHQDYRVVYDGYPTQGGGWYGTQYQAIHHSWSVSDNGGTFGAYASDGIVHEFGHSRRAVDLYALNVSAANNPVNASAYSAGTSVMNYPYGIRTWDAHSTLLINRNAGEIVESHDYITELFPSSFKVRVRNAGQPAGGATYSIYPVEWYSNRVGSSTIASGTIAGNGTAATLGSNPFKPSSSKPWGIRYCNLLVKVQHMSRTAYRWVPIDSVQMYAFAHPGASYTITIDVNPTSAAPHNWLDDIAILPTVAKTVNASAASSQLTQNYPNPFSGRTAIDFTLGTDGPVALKLYDAQGRELETVLDEVRSAGAHSVSIDGARLHPGNYFVRLTTTSETFVKTITVVR